MTVPVAKGPVMCLSQRASGISVEWISLHWTYEKKKLITIPPPIPPSPSPTSFSTWPPLPPPPPPPHNFFGVFWTKFIQHKTVWKQQTFIAKFSFSGKCGTCIHCVCSCLLRSTSMVGHLVFSLLVGGGGGVPNQLGKQNGGGGVPNQLGKQNGG